MAELVLRQMRHATADTSIPMSVYPNSGNSHDPRRSCPVQADNPPVSHPRRKLRPATRAAYARANLEAGAISREQAAVHLGVDSLAVLTHRSSLTAKVQDAIRGRGEVLCAGGPRAPRSAQHPQRRCARSWQRTGGTDVAHRYTDAS